MPVGTLNSYSRAAVELGYTLLQWVDLMLILSDETLSPQKWKFLWNGNFCYKKDDAYAPTNGGFQCVILAQVSELCRDKVPLDTRSHSLPVYLESKQSLIILDSSAKTLALDCLWNPVGTQNFCRPATKNKRSMRHTKLESSFLPPRAWTDCCLTNGAAKCWKINTGKSCKNRG